MPSIVQHAIGMAMAWTVSYPGPDGKRVRRRRPGEVVKTIVGGRGGMPAFIYYGEPIQVFWSDEGLTSEEIAKVTSFIRASWGKRRRSDLYRSSQRRHRHNGGIQIIV